MGIEAKNINILIRSKDKKTCLFSHFLGNVSLIIDAFNCVVKTKKSIVYYTYKVFKFIKLIIWKDEKYENFHYSETVLVGFHCFRSQMSVNSLFRYVSERFVNIIILIMLTNCVNNVLLLFRNFPDFLLFQLSFWCKVWAHHLFLSTSMFWKLNVW